MSVVENLFIITDTALSGVMRYTTGGQDAHPTRVLLLKFVPHNIFLWLIFSEHLSKSTNVILPIQVLLIFQTLD
ncbi:MAG: hypothetical protein ACKO9R_17975 [Dolichospermum sp.]